MVVSLYKRVRHNLVGSMLVVVADDMQCETGSIFAAGNGDKVVPLCN